MIFNLVFYRGEKIRQGVKAVFIGKQTQQHLDMIPALFLVILYASAAEELPDEIPSPHCNCTQVLQSEETATTDFSPTFPTTSFTCWGRYDGYYADVEVDCTIFHYCQTWYFPTGLNETVKWDFACPQSTIFNQKILSCTPPGISFDCQESPNYYWVNYNLTTTTTTPVPTTEFTSRSPNFGQQLIVGGIGAQSATFPDSEQPTDPPQLSTPSDAEQSDTSFPTGSTNSPNIGESGSGEPPGEIVNNGSESEAIKFPM